jgi:transposase
MPFSKQRNKHIQQVLVEAAKLSPRYSHELALVYERERQRGNKNRATLAVARKMVAYMLAVERRKQDFVPAEELGGGSVTLPAKGQNIRITRCAGCQASQMTG